MIVLGNVCLEAKASTMHTHPLLHAHLFHNICLYTCFRASQAMQQFGHEELGHTSILDTKMHVLQSSQGKMQVFKMCLLGHWITLNGDNALLRFS
jgi:hypothetical protein